MLKETRHDLVTKINLHVMKDLHNMHGRKSNKKDLPKGKASNLNNLSISFPNQKVNLVMRKKGVCIMREATKTHATHGISQFELTKKLLNNLSQFEVSPIAKLVLLELSACYNPNKPDMFPKQKTLAQKIGVSERSIVRAVQELFKAGLILIEYKQSNRYVFTSKIVSELPQNEKNFNSAKVSEKQGKNFTSIEDNLTSHVLEQERETKKEQTEVISTKDRSKLEEYAKQKGARNVQAYVNTLIRNDSAVTILSEYRRKENIERFWQKRAEETKTLIAENEKIEGVSPNSCPAWVAFKQKHGLS